MTRLGVAHSRVSQVFTESLNSLPTEPYRWYTNCSRHAPEDGSELQCSAYKLGSF